MRNLTASGVSEHEVPGCTTLVPIKPHGAVLLHQFKVAATRSKGALGSSGRGEHAEFVPKTPVTKGTILTCACNDFHGQVAVIFASALSDETIGRVNRGERVEATGDPLKGIHGLMVPIKPQGVVKQELFDVMPAAHFNGPGINAGTILTSRHGVRSVPIFDYSGSTRIIGRLQDSSRVEAAGEPAIEDGHAFVPLKPQGSAKLELLEEVTSPGITDSHDKGSLVGHGSVLTCIDSQGAQVFRSTRSDHWAFRTLGSDRA